MFYSVGEGVFEFKMFSHKLTFHPKFVVRSLAFQECIPQPYPKIVPHSSAIHPKFDTCSWGPLVNMFQGLLHLKIDLITK
jgi:hypothetical protein